MNDEENLDIPHPDPAWDYYIQWHKLIRAKTQLEKVIEFIATIENFTESNQDALIEEITKVISTLESIS